MTASKDADRIAELEEDNMRLRRMLDGQDAPGELRHRLRNTLALLRAVVRKSAETERDRADYAAHLEDRLDAIARAQALADGHGYVDLRTLLSDELLQYGASEGDRLLLAGPEVQFQPRAGQVMALAIHELAVNAVEHGALGFDTGRLEVSWSVAAAQPHASLLLSWTEFGPDAGEGPARQGFGTEVLTRMLPYELKAEPSAMFEVAGLRFTMHLPLADHIARSAL